ncbi:MAG TPA: DUF1343 domain-containing protein, partial [Cytophagales bacterium]|nr:DUF1343 domain-containing protein [Cytophagales bacterium]
EKIEDEVSLKYLIKFYHEFPDTERSKFFIAYFDKLAGTKLLKRQIENGMSEDEIKKTWQKDLKAFKVKRKKYLLYP